MATLKQIQFKRSKTAGQRPAASVLAEGELAINLKDRVLFTKDDQGNIIDLGFAKGGSIDGNVIHKGNYNCILFVCVLQKNKSIPESHPAVHQCCPWSQWFHC